MSNPVTMKDFKQAQEYAKTYGVKSIVYGPAGSGKTPIINTASRPILLACEPGMLSMRGSNVPTYATNNPDQIDEFFKWCFHSKESSNFDTICIDSGSQMAEIYLKKAERTNKHGLAAYGQMAEDTFKHLEGLYYLQQKHVYLVCKLDVLQSGMRRPYWPGKELHAKVPHLYDFILYVDTHNVPNVGQVRAFQCHQSIDTMARNRTGNLNMFEQPDFGALVKKAMQ